MAVNQLIFTNLVAIAAFKNGHQKDQPHQVLDEKL